ncbi:S1 family peptidase [Streptomyces sp. WMMB 322]|uniref:S1 family peptidase n=1 Tax=Streptomyces sp. WMMB 322 TaxID=1286821 RepID=UPI0006E14856|nr:S1 family peptidase [Streptomyces sp. WMMB 322]
MVIAGAGVAALVAGSVTLSTANASEDSAPSLKTLTSASASKLATKLTSDVKGDAGSYYDAKAKKLVVNVTDQDAKKQVEAAGAEARIVQHTMSQLKSVKDDFTAKEIAGTARMVDVKTNKVVITADRTVKGADLAQLKKEAKAEGSKVELKRTSGKYTTRIAGGDAIHGDGGRCSLGFNVTLDGQPAFLTAGHCTTAIASWSDTAGGQEIAKSGDGEFPGADYGIATYTAEVDHPSSVNLYDGGTQEISGPAEAEVGQQVTRSGSTTQVHEGTVTAVDASVTYPEGTVNGLIQTDVCAEPGDSGGSLFAGDKALGMTSGGSGDCSSGGETFFQPVTTALEATGAQLP